MSLVPDIERQNAAALAHRERLRAERPGVRMALGELAQMPLYAGTVPCRALPDVGFAMFLCDNDDGVALRFLWNGAFEPMSLALWATLARTAEIVLDVGAHSGCYTIAASRANAGANVLSFEPHAPNFARLIVNLRANKLATETAYNVAVSDTDGPVEFSVNTPPWYLSTGGRIGRRDNAATGRVTAIRLDGTAIQERGQVSLVKIDTEGHELQVLRSMTAMLERSAPDMLVECVFDSGTAEIEALLRARGYRFYLVDEAALGLDPVDDLAPSAAPESPDMDRVNRFVTTRPAGEVAELARDVRARLEGRLEGGARLAHDEAND